MVSATAQINNTHWRHTMDYNTTDTTYAVIKRTKSANNGYAVTYSKHAADGAANTGKYKVTTHKDFEGDTYYTVTAR
jgi:hypothetical protein